MKKIRVAIAGVGNCASSLVQGISFYRNGKKKNGKNGNGNGSHASDALIGLMNESVGGYTPGDIEFVAAFDIDQRKVGLPLEKAIFALPNCTKVFCSEIAPTGVTVQMGNTLDGISEHMKEYPEDRTFLLADKKPVDVAKVLKESGADILLNYMPVGSEEATRYYAQCALDAGVALVNCMPAFIVSHPEWAEMFAKKGIPCIGDDVKSQLGATILHRTLVQLCMDRGVKIDKTYQLNTGGNTDFLNMLNRSRLASKKKSKTRAVKSILGDDFPDENIHIGPSDYVPWQNDNKISYIRIEGRHFGGVPINIELRLSDEDSPNSAGVVIDAIRILAIALDREIGGPIYPACAYLMKHPPKQIPDQTAKKQLAEFIDGKGTRPAPVEAVPDRRPLALAKERTGRS